MKKGLGAILGIVVVIAIILIPLMGSYNGFVNAEEDVNQTYAQIENQLQRRMDLIPNLVNTVKGYAKHEEKVMEDIASARSSLVGAKGPEEQANADAALSSALSRLLVISENYPDLKADKQFTQLTDELSGTENRIAVARMDYNNQVTVFNKKVKQFPGRIVASIFGFDQKEYFKADAAAKEAPKVDFEGNGD
ncbi:LemA family protein [Lederbergia citrea]|uniref:LemA family protein n=1 Tax=Lederbergia citrea TaxID=2833581 RepID=A0A942UIE4_9BACI|nr:LemA family protein [Lederbergia citrea]MBS4176727.1 LemA family protein [Lederbergia citrea]MBS4203288.1 LemA family protein [Lederbergia citrea]MBS4222040.1 LemA family protein [Lederbergia citrea]